MSETIDISMTTSLQRWFTASRSSSTPRLPRPSPWLTPPDHLLEELIRHAMSPFPRVTAHPSWSGAPGSMTAEQRYYWRIALELKLRKSGGDAFQEFLSDVMWGNSTEMILSAFGPTAHSVTRVAMAI